MYQGKPTGVASQRDQVPWAILRANSDPTSETSLLTGHGPYELQLEPRERMIAMALLNLVAPAEPSKPPRRKGDSQQPSQVVQASGSSATQGGVPTVAISDLQVRRIARVIGEVVKMNDFDTEKTTLYITDYTENAALTDFNKDDEVEMGTEGDQFNYMNRRNKSWPGPWGRLTLNVTLWEPHASFARENVKVGDLVHLTYVRIKDGRQGGIEAAVHEDRKYPEKIHVHVIQADFNEQAQELMSRKQEYWKIHEKPGEDPKKAETKRKKKAGQKKEPRVEVGQKTLPASTSLVKKNPHGR